MLVASCDFCEFWLAFDSESESILARLPDSRLVFFGSGTGDGDLRLDLELLPALLSNAADFLLSTSGDGDFLFVLFGGSGLGDFRTCRTFGLAGGGLGLFLLGIGFSLSLVSFGAGGGG